MVFDGDESTGWAPENALPEDRWLELDLGRAVAAESIELVFAADAPPFALFDLMLSTGEPAVDLVANPIPEAAPVTSATRLLSGPSFPRFGCARPISASNRVCSGSAW